MFKRNRTGIPFWREFELLVARIEQTLAGNDVKVTSPDRIPSRLTHRKREVDASLRVCAGSTEVLVTIECRKRGSTQDVTWIEQLGSKRQAIGASRTIAVASTKFSTAAIQAASYYDIDLRVLSEITDEELQTWVLPHFVVHVYKCSDLIGQPEIVFYEQKDDDFKVLPPTSGTEGVDSAVFVGVNGLGLTLNDLWLRVDEQLKIYDTVPKDDKAHIRRVSVRPSGELSVNTRLGPRRVKEVKMTLSLRWKHERVLRDDAQVVVYRPADPDDPMRPMVRAEFQSKEGTSANFRLGLQFEPGESNVTVSVETVLTTKKQ